MFSIFKEYQLETTRDKFYLFFLCLFPVLMTALLGNLLVASDNPDSKIDPIAIEYIVEGENSNTLNTVSQLVGEFDDVEEMNLTASNSLHESKARVDSGEISAAVIFKDPFAIQIYEGSDSIQNRAVHMIFSGIARITGSYDAIENAMRSGDIAPLTENNLSDAQNLSGSFIKQKEFGISRTMMDYYAISMIVMIIFMGGISSGASLLYAGRKDGTLKRTLASPNNRTSIYLQYVVSHIPANLVQVAIVMVIASTFFGAHYAITWQDNILLFVMLFLAGQATSTIALIIGIFLKKVNPIPVLLPIVWTILFLSGTFSKEISIPGFSEFLPPRLIQNAAFDLTLFGKGAGAVEVMLVSLVVIVIASIVGSLLFNRKKVYL
jgi:ABC-2 type transport system permease protein